VKTGPAMTLPVSSSTLARAVQTGAVVAALVGPPCFCQGGRVAAFIVAAAHHLVHGRAAVGGGILRVVEGYSTVTRHATPIRHQRRGRRSCRGGSRDG